MKYGSISAVLAIGYLVIWPLILTLLLAPTLPHADQTNAFVRLWLEVAPLLAVLAGTLIMRRWFDKKTDWPCFVGHRWRTDMSSGIAASATWLGVSVGLLYISGVVHFEAGQPISLLPVWILAAIINVIMQEYLVRGYLFSMLARRHSQITAAVATTILFIAMHGLAGGMIGVINVALANLIFTLLLIRTGSLLAPILAHIVWNVMGGIILGTISLGNVYPHWLQAVYSGSAPVTGGDYMLEGSIVTTVVSASVLLVAWLLLRPRGKEGTYSHA